MPSLAMRFWTKVDITTTNKCWNWRGRLQSTGYGQFRYINHKREGAHRVAYELVKGKIPSGLFVLHDCDNRACVNPNHLRVGTQKENCEDATKRNRWRASKGKKHYRAKITEVTASYIKEALRLGVGPMELSRDLQISFATVYQIKDGKLWKHA